MKCPKCGYVSFDYYDNCKQCNEDLTSLKKSLKINSIKPTSFSYLMEENREPDPDETITSTTIEKEFPSEEEIPLSLEEVPEKIEEKTEPNEETDLELIEPESDEVQKATGTKQEDVFKEVEEELSDLEDVELELVEEDEEEGKG